MKKLSILLIAVLLTALVVSAAFAQKSEHQLTTSANPFANSPTSLDRYVSDRGVVGDDISANRQLMLMSYCTYLPIFMTNVQQGAITYSVAMQLKNLDTSSSAIVEVYYYNQDGSVNSIVGSDIPAGGSISVQPPAQGFNGSAVTCSDRVVYPAIANVFANGVSGMGASYSAFLNGSSTSNLPLIMRNHFGFNTWFNVQNMGNSATTVTITYSNGATEQATIQQGAAQSFFQKNNTALTDPLGDVGFVGSAIVESDGESIGVTVLEQGSTTLLAYSGLGGQNSSTNPVMPLVNSHNFGFMTGIQIQNTSDTNTDVTVSYIASLEGTDCTETKTVPANDSVSFAINAFSSSESGENCIDGETFVGSASVTSNSTNQPLVGVINQLNSNTNKGAAYSAFNPDGGTSRVDLPLIMDRNFGYWTGFSIVNVGTLATNITCTYAPNAPASVGLVPPGAALTVINENNLADSYVGAATCTASGGAIVGIVNELNQGATSDSFLVYEGLNLD